MRARQMRRRDTSRNQVLPVLIHGDAAFAGQGVVTETLNLSETRGYSTGGTVHVIVNNLIGFTNSDPLDSRSSSFCTDVAKLVQAPIFHVNGNDPEAVAFVAGLALDYRMEFGHDVVIDLVCYRRHGHNEADEPMVTQPLMYAKIRKQPGVHRLYAERLEGEGVIAEGEAKRMYDAYLDRLEAGEPVSRPLRHGLKIDHLANWEPYLGPDWRAAARDRHPRRGGGGDRAQALRAARALSPAPGGGAPHDGAARDGAGRAPGRLGLRRDAGLRIPAPGRLLGTDVGAGLRARDVRPPPRHRAQPGGPRHLAVPRPSRRRPAAGRDHQFAPLGGGGPRVRVRLQLLRAGGARHLGGPVRRLREQRPGGDRPVPELLGSEVGTLLGDRDAPPPRLRGGRPRALVGAARALPPALRGGQPPGLHSHHPGPDLPPPQAADDPAVPQAPRRHEPEEPAQAPARGVRTRGAHPRPRVRGRDRRPARHRTRAG